MLVLDCFYVHAFNDPCAFDSPEMCILCKHMRGCALPPEHAHVRRMCVQEYASMGPAYVEHLIRANLTKSLTLAAEAADDNRCGADTRAALVPLDLLVRR